MQNYTFQYNEDSTILEVHISNNAESMMEAAKEIMRLANQMKYTDPAIDISSIINEYYTPSNTGRVAASELLNLYCEIVGKNVTPQAFGRMMTSFISSEHNIHGIKRMALGKGTCYAGIKKGRPVQKGAPIPAPITIPTEAPVMVERPNIPTGVFIPTHLQLPIPQIISLPLSR
jgi:hypothetical protein